jgi:two-component system response regulator VicR
VSDMPVHRILLVDDDPLICKGLKFNLEQAGYQVATASTAHTALEISSRLPFDIAILDVGLPDDSGLDLCRKLKDRQNLPVIFLTARRRELDEIVGLEVGGDDYVTKPFSTDLLLARIRAVLRRSEKNAPRPEPVNKPIIAGQFELNYMTHIASKQGLILDLAPLEFSLLHLFVSHPDRVYTSDELVESIWGVEYKGERQVLYVQIRSLREKIEEDPSNPRHIVTLRGVGYKFVP